MKGLIERERGRRWVSQHSAAVSYHPLCSLSPLANLNLWDIHLSPSNQRDRHNVSNESTRHIPFHPCRKLQLKDEVKLLEIFWCLNHLFPTGWFREKKKNHFHNQIWRTFKKSSDFYKLWEENHTKYLSILNILIFCGVLFLLLSFSIRIATPTEKSN